MANSYVEYSSGLTATTYSIPFNYIAIADVEVKGYNGSTWSDLTVASRDNAAKTITLSAAPSTYQKIRVWRNTSTTQLVDFQNGSRLSESDLDTAYHQGLFVAQEVSENASTEVEGIGPQGPQGIQGVAGADGTDPFDSSGNLIVASCSVGIGTNNPSADLEIATSASDTGVDLVLDGNKSSNGGVGSIIFNNAGDSVGMIRSNRASANDAADMLFYTQATGGANSERMRIAESGELFVGGFSSSLSGGNHKLQIYTDNSSGDSAILIKHRDATGITSVTAQNFLNNAGTTVGSITMTSSGTAYNTSSDYRLKENVVNINDGITRVKQLEPKKFNFIGNADATVDGFLAHEAQTVVQKPFTEQKTKLMTKETQYCKALTKLNWFLFSQPPFKKL